MNTITITEAARTIQVSKPRLYAWIRAGELQQTNGGLHKEDVDYIFWVRNHPKSIGKIDIGELADIFSLNYGTVRRCLNKLNIKPQILLGRPLYPRKQTILFLWNHIYRKGMDPLEDFSIQ